MNKIWTVFKKENKVFFKGSTSWVVFLAYIFITFFATIFAGGFFSLNNAGLYSFFSLQTIALLFLIPAITMRLWAEERKNGTLEFLLTQPLTHWSIVLGKFFSSWFICLLMFLLTLPMVIYMQLNFMTDDLNILAGYLTLILVSGALCALSCAVSSFCGFPAISYIAGFISISLLVFGNYSKVFTFFDFSKPFYFKTANALDFEKQYYDMITGQISLDNLCYFGAIIILSLSINKLSIEYKKN